MKEHKFPYVHCSVLYNHRDMEVAQLHIGKWVEKTTVGHWRNGILPRYKKEENFDSMDGPGEHYAQWNKPVRERQIPYDFNFMWNLMNTLN